MSEGAKLDSNSLKDNKKLKLLIELRIKYKIPLIILLTHSDVYCTTVKNGEKDWKIICQKHFEENKNELLNYINKLIKDNFKIDFKFDKEDIIHVVLVEITKELSNEEVIEEFDEETKKEYEEATDEEAKKDKIILFRRALQKGPKQVENFIKEKMHFLGQKELIEKIKERLPIQYHNSLVDCNKKKEIK